jgi:hypothetical protein
MTKFLRTEGGDLINADQISQIEADGERRCKATLLNGSAVSFRCGIDRIERRLGPVLAAAPGCTVLDYGEDDHGAVTVVRLPVVGWRLAESLVTPVTPADDDLLNPDGESTVLLPDGQVFKQGDQTWPNEVSWFEEMEKQAKGRREQKSAKSELRPV